MFYVNKYPDYLKWRLENNKSACLDRLMFKDSALLFRVYTDSIKSGLVVGHPSELSISLHKKQIF